MESRIKNSKPLEKRVSSFEFILKTFIGTILGTLDCILEVLNDFTGNNTKTENESLYKSVISILGQQNTISKATKSKKEQTIINTQIVVMSESDDRTSQENNALSVCQSFHVLDEDNELVYKKIKKPINIIDYDFKTDTLMCSSDECQNFIQLPADTLLKDFKIDHIENIETDVPLELQIGVMCLGTNIFKGTPTKAYNFY